jgi:hypothetical protein
MNITFRTLPSLLTIVVSAAMLLHGPIMQFSDYHQFADQSNLRDIPHAANVLSNLGFGLIALWGIVRLWPLGSHPAHHAGRYGYRLFLTGLLLTAFGSTFYHLAPDNARLLWDRLPVALACAGLLAAVRAENVDSRHALRDAVMLGMLSVAGVLWWRVSDLRGSGDLRGYLLFQILPLVLIPLWQAIYRAPEADRRAFAAALMLYVLAKLAEIGDHRIFALLHPISGHTLKHLLATAAAAVIVGRLVQRLSETEAVAPGCGVVARAG